MDSILKRAFILGLCLTATWGPPILAQRGPNEYEVKAACLYHFLKYVDWPVQVFGSAKSPFIIGVLGEDPFGNMLDATVADKSINERRILIRRSSQLEDLKTCHLLFIGQSEKVWVKKILSGLQGTHVLTVSEFDSFAAQGGMINFTVTANKVRFEINLNAVQRAGLKVSSKLLNVAKIVAPEPRPEGN